MYQFMMYRELKSNFIYLGYVILQDYVKITYYMYRHYILYTKRAMLHINNCDS